MTIVSSNQTVFLIADLASEVILRLENRTTDIARAYVWIRDALLEISGNGDYRDDFDELEVLGPIFNLTIGQQEYSFDNLVLVVGQQSSGYNLATLDISLWTDYPTNQIRRKLNMTSYQDADKFQLAQSIPTEWYRFGNNIGFNPVPNQSYQVQARILQRHPINDVQLNTTQILLPREWNEVLIWSAVMRGFAELLQFEKSSEIRTLLQGDPKFPGKPGLIESVKKRRKREGWRQESSLRHIISGYGWGS